MSYKQTLLPDFQCLSTKHIVLAKAYANTEAPTAQDPAEDLLVPPPRCPIPYPRLPALVIYSPIKQRRLKQRTQP